MTAVSWAGCPQARAASGSHPGYGLPPEDAVDQERQGPGLEQVEPDAKEQQTQRNGYPPRVRPEVTQRPEQLAETPDGGGEVARSPGGVHTGNLARRASHMPAVEEYRTANAWETYRLLEAWVSRRRGGAWSPRNSYTDDRVGTTAAPGREVLGRD